MKYFYVYLDNPITVFLSFSLFLASALAEPPQDYKAFADLVAAGFASEKSTGSSSRMDSHEDSHEPFADFLKSLPPGGGYVGLGHEPNYTFIALSRPSRAYLYDMSFTTTH